MTGFLSERISCDYDELCLESLSALFCDQACHTDACCMELVWNVLPTLWIRVGGAVSAVALATGPPAGTPR